MARFKGVRGAAPRLKWRYKLCGVGIVLFMVTVSYYILKPEISAYQSQGQDQLVAPNDLGEAKPANSLGKTPGEDPNVGGGDEKSEEVVVKKINLPPSLSKLRKEDEVPAIPVEKFVEQMIAKFAVNFSYKIEDGRSPWEIAANWVTKNQVLPEFAPELGAVLNALATAPVLAVDNGKGGTQLKLFMELEGKQHVVFKPKWYERDKILEGLPYTGLDRHNGEIAAFHLSRVLGMRKTPLAVGRKVSISRDIIAKASKDLAETFFEEDGKVCFYGKCRYCNKESAKCVEDDTMEGAVILWLPSTISIGIDPHPWRRTYRHHIVARWERDNNYCNNVVRKSEKFITDSALLLELIDTSIFDYLIGNADRHHYEFVAGQPHGMVLLMDNGKSFGNPNVDERSILAPLYQCCSVHFTTWKRLQALRHGVLSSIMREVMRTDPISPILTRQHLEALDRRLEKVLREIENCIEVNGLQSVILETEADSVKESDL